MFVLRLRDPVRYGKWRERGVFEQDEDAAARRAEALLDCTEQEAEKAASRGLLLRNLGANGETDEDGEPLPDSGADVV